MRTRFFLVLFILTIAALAPLCLLFAGSDTTVVTRQTSSAVPTFTLDKAILTALRQNADILRAREEIERTKGLYIQMRAGALPRIDMTGDFQDTEPHLLVNHGDTGSVAVPIASPGITP